MKKFLTAAFCAAVLLTPISSIASYKMIFSGNDFLNLHKSDSTKSSGGIAFAYGFVNGAYSQLLATVHARVPTKYFDCWDHVYFVSEMTLQQVMDTFSQYLGRHLHEANKPAIDLFNTAILNKFPINAHAVHECVKKQSYK